MHFLKQSTAQDIVFVLVLATDNQTEVSGVTPTCTILKPNANSPVPCANTPSSKGNGIYRLTLSATETDTDGYLIVRAEYTGAAVVRREYYVGDMADFIQSNLMVTITQVGQDDLADTMWRRDLSATETATGKDALGRNTPLAVAMATVGAVSDVDGTVTVKAPSGSTLASWSVTTLPDVELVVSRT